MFLSTTAVLLAVLPFSLASSTCTTSNALSWATSGSTTSGSSGISSSDCSIICGTDAFCLQECNSDPCAEQFGNDSEALQACYEAEQQASCNILGGSACDKKKKKKKREVADDTLTCLSSETCYEYTDGSLFCLDEATGDYVDDIGGFGNVNTGDYTGPDGSQTTFSSASAASSITRSSGSSTATTSDIRTTTRVAAATSSSSSSVTRATAISASSSASAAAKTANSGVGKVNAGPVIGVVGLMAALLY
ncbi:hypothetical protein OCU04_011206 [Sclerotinia nivalis]|uniref:Extracellular membrane protein CFEM domain-containing protein n=1 Tax=Sclerotinia nivalis TaxID=352851 RepID=A0A9X0DEH5_9HELO|nr:hypothetical protein OCU04_011206 [Sclerotinia nivalis]